MPYEFNPLTGQFEFIPYTPAGGTQQLNFTPAAQPPPAVPSLGGQGGAAPFEQPIGPQRPTFSQNHPKLAGFLQNLGPALGGAGQAGAFQPLPTTPYPVSGLSSILQALGQGGQAFQGAQQGVEQAEMGRLLQTIRRGPAVKGGLQSIAAGQGATPEQAQAIQLATGAEIESPGERARRTGGALKKGEEEQLKLEERKFQFTSTFAQKELDFNREKLAADVDRWGGELGIERNKLAFLKDNATKEIATKFAAIVNDQPYTDRGRQQPIIEKMVSGELRGVPYTPTPEEAQILASMQPPTVTAAAIRSQANRTMQGFLVSIIESQLSRPVEQGGFGPNWRQDAPREVLDAYAVAFNPLIMTDAEVDFQKADQLRNALSTLESYKLLPGGASQGLLSRVAGGVLNFVSGGQGTPEAGGAARTPPQAAPPTNIQGPADRAALQREYTSLFNKIQAGTATEAERTRAREIQTQIQARPQ